MSRTGDNCEMMYEDDRRPIGSNAMSNNTAGRNWRFTMQKIQSKKGTFRMVKYNDGSYVIRTGRSGHITNPAYIKDAFGLSVPRECAVWMHVIDALKECVQSGTGRITVKGLIVNDESRTMATYDNGVLTVALDDRKNLIPFKNAHIAGTGLTEIKVSKRVTIETDGSGKGYMCFYKAHSRPDSKPAVKMFWVADLE